MRVVTIVMLALAALLGAASPALGHAGLVPGEISPDDPQPAQVVLAHGCGEDGQIPPSEDEAAAVSAVSLDVPAPLQIIPQEVDGWSLTYDEEAGQARWTHDGPDGATGAVALDVVVDATELDAGEQLWVPVTQECVDGSAMVWDHLGPAETVDDRPAMSMQVASAATPASSDGLPTPVVIALAISLAVVAGGVVIGVSGRRAR